MTTWQIKDVPDDVFDILSRRAQEAGLTLEQYLLLKFTKEAREPTLAEALARKPDG